MAEYLITGGAGFIGSHLARRLLAAGHGVVVLDDLSTGLPGNLPAAAELVQGCIAQTDKLDTLMARVAGCFHLAAVASVQQYRDGWASAARTNLIGSVRVLEAAAHAGVPVVYASSAAVYGDNPHIPLAEDAPLRPISGYGADKLGLELHAGAMAGALGLGSVGLRFFNVFGPRQAPGSPYSGVISIFFDKLSKGAPLTVFGDGTQSRDFVYVGDVARALHLAMDAATPGAARVFNICRDAELSINDLAAAVGRELGVTPQVQYASARAGDIRHSRGNGAAARAALGFVPEVPLSEGFAETARWFRSRV
ncbi:MAG: NAD-dependent epimerase/dehydratase family protein [Rhodobacteraceae bacterium]|nr:NAD-dependent epimerase/dehydratase family protein [Paracoccaceae bacterium]